MAEPLTDGDAFRITDRARASSVTAAVPTELLVWSFAERASHPLVRGVMGSRPRRTVTDPMTRVMQIATSADDASGAGDDLDHAGAGQGGQRAERLAVAADRRSGPGSVGRASSTRRARGAR